MPHPLNWLRRNINRSDLLCALFAAALYGTAFFLRVMVLFNDPLYGWEAYQAVAPRPWAEQPYSLPDDLQAIVWWLPNPLMWVGIALLAIGRPGSAAFTGLLALAGALSVAFDTDALRFDFKDLREGYYCWLGSMAFVTMAGAWRGLWPLLAGTLRAPAVD
jgi:hypothetical protein